MLCYYNIDEEKKWFLARAAVCVEYAHSSYVCTCFLIFSHIPKVCPLGELACINCLSVSEFGCGCKCALQWKGVLSRGDLTLHSELPAQVQAIYNPELE